MNYNRDNKGKFARKTNYFGWSLVVGFVAVMGVAYLFHGSSLFAQNYEREVTVTAEVDTRDKYQKVADNGAELSRLLKAQNDHTRSLREQQIEAEQLVLELEELIASSIASAQNIQEQINEVAWQLQTLGM